MKRRFMLGVLPVLASASLIASGYAAWIFSTTGSQASTINAELTGTSEGNVTVGSFATSLDSYKLVLDQTAGNNGNTTSTGVHFDGIGSVKFNYGMDATASETSMSSYNFTWTVSFTVNTNLAEYVSFTYNGQTLTYTEGKSQDFTLTSTWTKDGSFTIYDSSDSTLLLTPSYATGKEPGKLADYNTMKTAIFGSDSTTASDLITINVSYVATAE